MSIRNKIIATIVGLSLVAMLIPSGVAQAALTEVQIQSILSLLTSFGADTTTVANVESSLRGTTPVITPTVTGIPAGFTFTKTLQSGSVDQDIVYLKIVLVSEGCLTGVSNTTYFGSLTKAAVQCFQAKYGTGSLGTTGPNTRAKLNAIIGGIVIPPVVPPTTAGGLSVGLAADTPASGNVPNNGNANFTKFSLTAGSGDVSITKIYVTRAGLSTNSAVENIKIVDVETGSYKGSIGSLNVDNRAMITFTPALKILAGTTKNYYIRAGIVSSTTTAPAGNTVSLGIVANTDIVSNATAVNGAPATGNSMSVVNLTIGTVAIEEDGTTVDTTPDVGDTNVTINQFRLTAGSTETVIVDSITALKSGTADVTDTNNIELYDVTHSKSLGTAASWDSEEKATWGNLGITIGKGETLRLKVMADIAGGVASTALTVRCDLVDGSDTLVSAKGGTYGFFITPTRTGSWSGLPTNPQTINAGALNLSKSSSTPATGNISTGSDIPLGVFDFDARGEEMRITGITVEATIATVTIAQVTNIKIYDENGTIVAGPKDLAGTTPNGTVSFTDTFIVPVGVHKYTVKAKIADAVATGSTIRVGINEPGTTSSLVVKGMTSGDTITATPVADLAANTLTVAAGDVDELTLTTPVSASVPKGVNDYIWATASLSAADSGENVLVSTISVLDTTSDAADIDDIDNAEIWADLTSANSTRGDAYETKISNTEALTGATGGDITTAITLTQTLTIAKGGFIKVALIADLNASAAGTVDSDSHRFSFSAGTFTGATSGEDISESVNSPAYLGPTMTITTGGALTITKDSTSPVADLVISGETSTLAVFRLAASNVENLDVDDITVTCTNGSSVDTFYLYKGTTLLGEASSSTAPKFTLADGTLPITKNTYARVTVKGKMVSKDDTTNTTAVTVSLQIADAVNATGLASGGEVDSNSQSASGSAMTLYKTKPVFTAVSSRSGYTLSGNLIPASSSLVAIFDVTANASEDVTFEKSGAGQGGLVVHVSQVVSTSNGTANTWYLKDQDGTQLDSTTVADTVSSSATFNFSDAALTVPAGQTKSLLVYADTSEMDSDGDTIQLHLDDDADANVTWSINNGAVPYQEGTKIFRGDIYSGSFSNPQ